MANLTIGIRDGETYQDAQDRWDACNHEGKVVTDGANGWDPAWVIDWYCPKCGVSQSFDHKHEYVPTGEKFVSPITGKEYEYLKCTKCRHTSSTGGVRESLGS